MKTYRIAFLTCDWNYELVESTLRGLKCGFSTASARTRGRKRT